MLYASMALNTRSELRISLGQEVAFVSQVCATRKEEMTCGHLGTWPHVGWKEDHLDFQG